MNRFFTLLLTASCLTAVGQVTYPYNPDGNADTLIGVTDLQDLLVVYGNPFLPQEVLVDGEPLSDVIGDLQTQIESMQLALGTTEYYWWQDLSWEAATDPNTTSWESVARFDPDTDGFLTVNMNCTGGGNGFVIGVIPDSIEYADRLLLQADFSESLTEGNYSRTIALSKSDCVVFSAMIEQIPQICPRQPTISWTPITIEASGQPQETDQTLSWVQNEEDPLILEGALSQIRIVQPAESLESWWLIGNPSVNSQNVHYMPYDEIESFIVMNGITSVTWMGPWVPEKMIIDISQVSSESLAVEFDRIRDERQDYYDLMTPFTSLGIEFGFFGPSFNLDIIDGEVIVAQIEGFYRDWSMNFYPWAAPPTDFQEDYSPFINGIGAIKLKRLSSGQWIRIL